MEHLEMIQIRKEFPGIVANDGINLAVRGGEVLGLLGENGAGKSTLMNVLFGLYPPDGGEIRVNGARVRIASPREAMRLGIGMVHQHFMLIPTHTVAENLALALPDVPFLRPTAPVRDRLAGFAERYGLRVDPAAYVWELSAGQQQRVEILKALLGGADLLVLDEPTSVLTPQEADELFAILARMRQEGHAIIFITHKLDEIMRTTDRIQVLRQGRDVGTLTTAATTKEELAACMVGRAVSFDLDKKPLFPGEPILEVEHLTVLGTMDRPAVRDLSLTVHIREIVGIAGVSGNGQKELVETIAGLRPPAGGTIRMAGRPLPPGDPRAAAMAGIAHIPEERLRFGVVGNLDLAENAVLKDYHTPANCRWGMLRAGARADKAKAIVRDFQVVPPRLDAPIRSLSGGNVQKFLVGRELWQDPPLVLASHPTYGVDIGAAQMIRKRLLWRRSAGGGVLLVSEDLDEVLALADRVAVIYEGTLRWIDNPRTATRAQIGLLMGDARDRTGAEAPAAPGTPEAAAGNGTGTGTGSPVAAAADRPPTPPEIL
ncbi:MAG: ABC transporter ATP-binding protein [Candidatus Riflebacteria bacterium]|nr:ABC transporter ATP-binding protein [Candidatus Riflebacteria bacterium]